MANSHKGTYSKDNIWDGGAGGVFTLCAKKILCGIFAIFIGNGASVNTTVSFGHPYNSQAHLSLISSTRIDNKTKYHQQVRSAHNNTHNRPNIACLSDE